METKFFWIVMFMCMKMSSMWFHFPKPSGAMRLDIEDNVIFFKLIEIGTQLMNGWKVEGKRCIVDASACQTRVVLLDAYASTSDTICLDNDSKLLLLLLFHFNISLCLVVWIISKCVDRACRHSNRHLIAYEGDFVIYNVVITPLVMTMHDLWKVAKHSLIGKFVMRYKAN